MSEDYLDQLLKNMETTRPAQSAMDRLVSYEKEKQEKAIEEERQRVEQEEKAKEDIFQKLRAASKEAADLFAQEEARTEEASLKAGINAFLDNIDTPQTENSSLLSTANDDTLYEQTAVKIENEISNVSTTPNQYSYKDEYDEEDDFDLPSFEEIPEVTGAAISLDDVLNNDMTMGDVISASSFDLDAFAQSNEELDIPLAETFDMHSDSNIEVPALDAEIIADIEMPTMDMESLTDIEMPAMDMETNADIEMPSIDIELPQDFEAQIEDEKEPIDQLEEEDFDLESMQAEIASLDAELAEMEAQENQTDQTTQDNLLSDDNSDIEDTSIDDISLDDLGNEFDELDAAMDLDALDGSSLDLSDDISLEDTTLDESIENSEETADDILQDLNNSDLPTDLDDEFGDLGSLMDDFNLDDLGDLGDEASSVSVSPSKESQVELSEETAEQGEIETDAPKDSDSNDEETGEKKKKKGLFGKKKDKDSEENPDDKEKKPGLLKRLFLFLTEEEVIEDAPDDAGALASISDENAALLEEGNKSKKKKKEKKPKEKKKKEPKPKKEKKPKEKKPKKEKPPKEPEKPTKPIGKKKIAAAFALGISTFLIIMLLTTILPGILDKTRGIQAFKAGKYEESYDLLHGKKLKKDAEDAYKGSLLVLELRNQLSAYEAHHSMESFEIYALNDLINAVGKYDIIKQQAGQYNVEPATRAAYLEILTILNTEYGVSEEEAVRISTIVDKIQYTKELEIILGLYSMEDQSLFE